MDMSKCSKKCNEIKEKIDSISGLDDDFVFEILCKIENQLDLINIYADEDKLNGTCFKKSKQTDCKHENLKLVEFYIKGVANRKNYFVKCESCMQRTRNRNTPLKAITEFQYHEGSLYEFYRK